MSNSELKSRLSQLESELSSLERYNSELQSELSSISYGVRRANRDLEDFNSSLRTTLNRSHNRMRTSHESVVNAIELHCEIEQMYVRFKHMELANKKIREANNKIYFDFANYRNVRKLVQGIMDNLDLNMVRDETIIKSVEVQHLQTPDYWLTCVLISVMAWRNDDRVLADRAIARAIALDRKNSAIFYMLFNLKMGRDAAALKWFYTYQECVFQGSDQRTFLMLFSLISKTLTNHVAESTKSEIQSFIRQVVDANMKTSSYTSADVIAQIREHFNRMLPSDQPEYSMLRKYCTEFKDLSDLMMQAKNNINILEFILHIVNVPAEQRNLFLKDYIDELIETPNPAEKVVRDEIAYNETIIQLRGDVEKAKKVFAAAQTKKGADLCLIPEIIDWIYVRDTQDINGQIRLSMFTLTKSLHEWAVHAHVNDYRVRRRNNYQVEIGEYSAKVDFSKQNAQSDKITSHFTAKRDEAIAAIKKWPAYAGFGVGILSLIAMFFFGTYMLLPALLGAGAGIFTLFINRSRAKYYEQECSEKIKSTNDVLQGLFLEFQQYQDELDEYDAYYELIKKELDKL